MTSVSESTATLASGRMNPLVSGAATTQAPAVPGAAASTGACTPSAARAAESRLAPGAVAAHRVTEYPCPTNPVTPAARRAGSPATGSNRRTVRAAVAGPSGTGGSAVTPAALSLQQALERHVQAREGLLLALLAPPRWRRASRPAPPPRRAAARRGRGSGAAPPGRPAPRPAGDRAGPAAVSSRNGSHDSMPSNCSPSARCSQTDAPQGRRVARGRGRGAHGRREDELAASEQRDGA